MQIKKGLHPDRINVRWTGPDSTRVIWGDGSATENLAPNRWLVHHYETPGGVRVRVRSLGGVLLAESLVVIRTHTEPPVSVRVDPDDPGVLLATVTEDELDGTGILPYYRVQWQLPDISVFTDMWGFPGATVRHRAAPGAHRVRVEDLGTHRDFITTVTVDEPSVAFSLAAEQETVTLTVTKANAGKDLVVAWGDGGLVEPVSGTTATHTYPAPDTYLVELSYADASDAALQVITVGGLFTAEKTLTG